MRGSPLPSSDMFYSNLSTKDLTHYAEPRCSTSLSAGILLALCLGADGVEADAVAFF
jgi:hypothetical protein